MTTHSPKLAEAKRAWYILDAQSAPLGRIASAAAGLLLGKGKPDFSSHLDNGDFVIIVNARQLRVTGDKLAKKQYYRHSRYPSGLRVRSLSQVLQKDAKKVIHHAIRGMLPDNKLRAARLKRLKVYEGADHQHQAQQPAVFVLNEKGSS